MHLSNEEDLAYRRLLETYYDSEQPISDDHQLVARRLRVDLQALEFVLKEFFVHTSIGWKNKRCDLVINDYQGMVEKNRKNGKKGGRPKATVHNEENPVGLRSVSDGMPIGTQRKANQEPITINQEPVTKVEKKQRGSRLPTDFEVPDDWVSFCQTERPDLHPHKIFDGFKDYWVAAPKGVKLDWTATWRNWVRNQKTEKVQESFFERDQKLKRERMKEFTPHVAGLKKIDPNTGFFIEEISDVYALTSR
jgi:uncharacterized protein YdaU (DUF1376 family)